MTNYISQAAKDAKRTKYGGKSYWDYLEESSLNAYKYYAALGMTELAESMLTRSLSESLQGNNGVEFIDIKMAKVDPSDFSSRLDLN